MISDPTARNASPYHIHQGHSSPRHVKEYSHHNHVLPHRWNFHCHEELPSCYHSGSIHSPPSCLQSFESTYHEYPATHELRQTVRAALLSWIEALSALDCQFFSIFIPIMSPPSSSAALPILGNPPARKFAKSL